MMTKHAFGAKVTETSADKCSHVRLYYTVRYCVPELRKECTDRNWEGNQNLRVLLSYRLESR